MKNIEDNKRLIFLDVSKGIGILAVMFGHITSIGNPVDRWISTFKLPIFFIITGFLICRSQEVFTVSFRSFAAKKAKSLLLPYFLFSLLTISYRLMIYGFKEKNLAQFIYRIKEDVYITVSFCGLKALWFLTALFFAEVIFYLVIRSHLAGKIVFVLISFLIYFKTFGVLEMIEMTYSDRIYRIISMPALAITRGVVGFLFISVGYILYLLMQKYPEKKQHFIVGIIIFIINIMMGKFLTGTLDFNNMRFGTIPAIFFVCALLGSIGWILVLEYVVDFYRFPVLSWCGGNSLILMATHTAFGFKDIMVNGWASVASLSSEAGLKYYVECLVILFLLLVFEYGVVDFVNKKAPFLIGRSKKKES